MKEQIKRLQIMKAVPDSVNAEARTLDAIISTSQVDRDGEIIEPSAFKARIDTFKDNPLLLWMHDPFSPPIGQVQDLKFFDDRVEASLKFAEAGTTELADDVFSLFKQGILRSFSVGFRVFKMEMEQDDDGNEKPPRITDAELFEVSAVSIPANPGAVAKRLRETELLQGTRPTRVPKALFDELAKTTPWKISELPKITDDDVLTKATSIVHKLCDSYALGEELSGDTVSLLKTLRVSLLGTDKVQGGDRVTMAALADLSDHLAQVLQEVK